MQSACDTPSSHSRRGWRSASSCASSELVAKPTPEWGAPGQYKVVAKERVRPAAGATGRIHERHATLRHDYLRRVHRRGM